MEASKWDTKRNLFLYGIDLHSRHGTSIQDASQVFRVHAVCEAPSWCLMAWLRAGDRSGPVHPIKLTEKTGRKRTETVKSEKVEKSRALVS